MLQKIGVPVAIIVAALFGLWMFGNHRYAEGRAEEKALWVAASEKEAARQAAVNATAQRWQRQALAELQKQNTDLSALIEANDAEAAKDPRAAAVALGRDSVRRIDAVR